MLEIVGLAAVVFIAGSSAGADAGVVKTQASDKMICRRLAETGSLVRSKRVCFTEAEWDRQRDRARRKTEEMQDVTMGTNGS